MHKSLKKLEKLYKRLVKLAPSVSELQFTGSVDAANELLYSVVNDTEVETWRLLFERLNNDLSQPWMVIYETQPCECCGEEMIRGVFVSATRNQKMPLEWYAGKLVNLKCDDNGSEEGPWVKVKHPVDSHSAKTTFFSQLLGEVVATEPEHCHPSIGERLLFERFCIGAVREEM